MSPDLREIAVQTGNTASAPLVVLDTQTGAQLSEAALAPTGYNSAFAFDPTRPYCGVAGPGGALGDRLDPARRAALRETSIGPASAEVIGVAPDAHAIDLTAALRALDLPTRCFAPITSDCDYRVDQPTTPPEAQRSPSPPAMRASRGLRPRAATGEVAILDGRQVAIWNPSGHRVERRLTGVPAKCDDFAARNLAFVGTATAGRVVLGCPPALLSWDLGSPASAPAWRYAWAGPSFNSPTPVLISDDDKTVGVTAFGGMQFVDARTGRLRAHGPTVEEDIQTGGAFSPDGHTYAQVALSGVVALIDTATGTVRRTLNSALGDLADAGVTCAICGPTSGNPPSVGFQPRRATARGLARRRGHRDLERGHGRGDRGARRHHAGSGRHPGRVPRVPVRSTLSSGIASSPRSASADTVQVADVRELVSVVAGVPTNNYTSRLRTVTWSLRPADWELAGMQRGPPRPHSRRVEVTRQLHGALPTHVHTPARRHQPARII